VPHGRADPDQTDRVELGGIGIWSAALRYGDQGEIADAAAELEQLGYSALWPPGGIGGPIFDTCASLLDATARVVVAPGIVNIWMHDPAEVAATHARLVGAHPGRFLLGLGVSHQPLVDHDAPGRYRAPLAAMDRYLDELDAATPPAPAAERLLAALGPRMLDLARRRSAGAHPYLVTPEHTHEARAVLGDEALLAPEQAVVVERDPSVAREIARQHLAIYLQLPNYARNWDRLGFDTTDVADGGSDRLVDALVAWGDVETIAGRVDEHRGAGADHVCIQALTADLRVLPRAAWRELAPALVG
jgi:probable F420-dependent oxidoreductase